MKYVSEKYEQQLHDLAETLCTPDRFGAVALSGVMELPFETVDTPAPLPEVA